MAKIEFRETKFRYTWKRKKDGHIWQQVFDIGFMYEGIELHFPYPKLWELVGRDQWTGMMDKGKNDIYENDLVVGQRSHMRGDGRLRKGYPREIDIISLVIFRDGSFEYPKELGAIPEHTEFEKGNWYRECHNHLVPLHKGTTAWNPLTDKWDIKGDGETCIDITLLDDVYHRPELLKLKKKHL